MDIYQKYVGQVFDRRYKILGIIGGGGMAVVFEALDTVMKRTVAVKMLREDMAKDTQSVKRFINESRAVSMLVHPNIVAIYDVAVRDDLKYIVMEKVEGTTLKAYINEHGALPTKDVLNFSSQILRALEHAHSKGIIHRDIKPQNIMICKNGAIKVADFGIAKLPNTETVTMTDKAIGTVYYISPEQASGKEIDPRSDLYSLGVLIYEMSTGKLPFMAESHISVAMMQVNNAPKAPREIVPSIPEGVEKLILTAMNKKPEDRFQNASQMLHCVKLLQKALFAPDIKYVKEDDAKKTIDTVNALSSTASIGMLKRKKRNHKKISKKNRKPAISDDAQASKKINKSMFPIISGVVTAFLIVLGVSAAIAVTRVISDSQANASTTVEIPNLAGSIYTDDLKAQLEAKDYFNIIITEVYDHNYEQAYIISQEPQAGEKRKVKAGSQYTDLKLTISQGAKQIKLGDYSYLDYRNVKNELLALGLKVEVIGEYNDTVISGYVTRTIPAKGSEVILGDEIKVYYSVGQMVNYVTVPSFEWMTEAQAVVKLSDLHLKYGNITYEYSDEYPKGTIMSQNRAANTEVPEYVTAIDFTVSLGPKDE